MYSGGVMGRARVRAVWVALLACGLGADARADKKKPGLFDFDVWKPPVTRERDFVRSSLAPQGVNLDPAFAPSGGARVIKVHIYADRDYRGTVLRWQTKVRAQIQRVNAVVAPVFNARFEIDSLREWDRSHVGRPLDDAMMSELVDLDPAKDADLVIGLVTPLRGVATSAHEIGMAGELSRHFLLRGMDDEQEFVEFEREFKLISPDERQRLYADRKAHKEVVIFLHEWGHTLGLIHHEDRKLIMNPAYSPQQSEFSDYDKRIVALVIDRRLANREAPAPEAADLLPLVEAMPADEGPPSERAQLLELVRRRAATRPGKHDPKDAVDLSDADVQAFNRAVSTLNAGHAEEAWKLLAPVIEHTRARKVGGNTWVRIAEMAVATGALTAADDAAGRAGAAPGAQKIVADIESTRHRVALPLDAAKVGVPPEREPAYVSGYWQTAKIVEGADVAAARARLGALAAAFPDAPGLEVLTCDLEVASKRPAAAAPHCEAALAKFKGATRAHVLLAVIALRARKTPVAEQHLRQAILLDPADPTGWRALAQLYRSTGARGRLAELANQHQALLSSPLPD